MINEKIVSHIKGLDSKNPNQKLEYDVPMVPGTNKSNVSAYQFADSKYTGMPNNPWRVQGPQEKPENYRKGKF